MSRPEVLLVHGSCHGAWCWRDLQESLKEHDIPSRAIDLPSHGNDPTPYSDVTLAHYRDAILGDIADHGDAPVILVGHSAGGFAISAAAEVAPDKIVHLVYVAAYVPISGMSLADMRRLATRQLVLDAIEKTNDGRAFTFCADRATAALYNDCSDEQIAYALERLCPQPIAPQETALFLSEAYESVPRTTVICTDDHTIAPEEQEKMALGFETDSIHRLASSHSPFFSMPDELAKNIAQTT
ncbi:alpha/beta fold hydrolase [Celeribacter arenosi]|uniref:Alpha/beta fold hydrolase n=1 Tax=Celeribacter arenosi TaxID=792649 RepID=A0ABP7K739_9RHOB